jgi:predicted nucleic acid-binding protein
VSEHIYLVDSSVWIRLFRRSPPKNIAERVDDLLERQVAATNGLITVEIVSGATNEKEFADSSATLGALHQLSLNDRTWSRAARLGYDLRRRGLTCLTPDLIIAASAIEHGAVLVHADADFDRIAANSGLAVESFANAV